MELTKRLDGHPITGVHLAIVAVCALGFSFDLLEIALGSVLSAVFSAPPQRLGSGELAWLLSSVYVGAVLGAPSLGWLGDRHGRKFMLAAMLLWLAPLSIAMAWAHSPVLLSGLRLLSGLSLGAYPATVMVYLTDVLPARRRGMFIFIAVAVASLGPPCGLLLVHTLTQSAPGGIEGWRWGFLSGGMGAGCGGLLFLTLPEPPRWLVTVGRLEDAWAAWRRFERSRIIMAAAATVPTARTESALPVEGARLSWRSRDLALMSAVFLLSAFGTSGFTQFSGAVMVQKGIKLTDTVLYLGISTSGQFLGTLLAAVIADRVERRAALVTCAIVMGAAALGFALSATALTLLVTSMACTVLISLYLPALFVYTGELFPTSRRSSATALAWTANRVASALVPFVLLPLLRRSGPLAMATVIVAALLGAAAALVAFAPRKPAGQPVG